jgi:hypothetical protein
MRPGLAYHRRATSLLVLAICVLLGACWSGEVASNAAVTDQQDVSREEHAFLTIETAGAVNFHWEQATNLRIVVLTPEEQSVHLFSVGLEDMQIMGDVHERFRFAFDLIGGYAGAGNYEIPAATGDDEGIRSGAFLVYARVIDPEADLPYLPQNLEYVADFNLPLLPCMVAVAEEESAGTIQCPELADGEGNTISLKASWRLIG